MQIKDIEYSVNEDIFKDFFENASVGMSVTSPNGQIRTNKAFCNLLGYNQEELEAVSWMTLTHPDDLETDSHEVSAILAGVKSSARWQKRYLHKSGNIIWVEVHTALHRDMELQPLFFITSVTDITEQIKLQNNLDENLILLRESQEIANLGSYSFNLLTGFWTSSDILNRIFGIGDGYQRSLVGWSKIIHPDWQDEMMHYVNEQVIEKRQAFDKEYKIVRISDGEERWLHGRGKLDCDADGNPVRLIGTIMDITDRKLVELANLESQKRIQLERNAIASLALDPFIADGDVSVAFSKITSIISEVIQVERASIWLFSDDRNELVCQSLFERSKNKYSNGMVLHSVDYPCYFNAIEKQSSISADDACSDPRTIEFANSYLKPLGIASLLDTGVVVEGKLAGVVCLEHIGVLRKWNPDEESFVNTISSLVAQTITNLRRWNSEEELRNSEERYRLLLNMLPDGIIVYRNGRIIYTNPSGTLLLGAESQAKILGCAVTDFLQPEQRDGISLRISKALNKGIPIPLTELKVVRLDGSVIDVEVITVPIAFAGELAMAAFANDISARKRSEFIIHQNTETIQAQNEEYQQLNEELNQTNEALLHSVERAEQSDRLKSAFLANMSHEIRTPLNSIIGFSELLAEEKYRPEEIQKYASIISASGGRLLRLVNDLIDISKIESGVEIVRKSEIYPYHTIQEVVGQFRLIAGEKSIEILEIVEPESRELILFTDPQKLHQILTNLLNNALKFTTEGSVEIGMNDQGDRVLFFVRDSGIGISPTHVDRIFDRFYQVDSSISRQFEGAGIGLSLCKAMVELLGGKISVESEVGRGSTFYFTLNRNITQKRIS